MDSRRVYLSKLPQTPLIEVSAHRSPPSKMLTILHQNGPDHLGMVCGQADCGSILEPSAVAFRPTAAKPAVEAAEYFYEMSYDSENHAMEDVKASTPPPTSLTALPGPPADPTPSTIRVLGTCVR